MNYLILEAALTSRAAGISVIPINPQTKRPHARLLPLDADGNPTWKPYQETIADEATIRRWYTDTDAQLGFVCGRVSGGLLVIDADVLHFYEAWREAVGDLADGLPMQETGNGRHMLMRCPDPGRNQHLAWRPDDAEETGRKIAMETRGEGGYIVAAPSLHPSGKQYRVIEGDLTAIPTISQARADALLAAARKLDEAPQTRQQIEAAAKVNVAPRAHLNGQTSVIDTYNQRVDVTDLLRAHRYTEHGKRWARPGGEHGSVTVKDGKSFHHNSNDPLCTGYWHDAFSVFCELGHQGDMKAAVKAAATELGLELPKHGTTGTTTRNRTHSFNRGAGRPHPQTEAATGDTPPTGKLLHADDLCTLPKPRDLIPGVLSMNKLNLIFGLPGVGKSHVNLDIALSVAQFANVVYLAGEDAEDYAARVQSWCEHHNLGTGGLHFWPEPVNLLNPDAVAAFLAEVAPLQPALIVIDTLANCMVGADENSTQHMGVAIDTLNYIRRQTQAAMLVCHHTGWSDTHERGSSALRGAVRVAMKVAQSDDGLISLTCEKSNNAAAFEPRYFRMVPKAESVALVPSSKLTGRDAPLKQNHYSILEALTLKTFTDGASFTQLVEHTNMAKSTVNYTLSKLLEREYVSSTDGRNKLYQITGTGKHELQTFLFQSAAPSSTAVQSQFKGDLELALNWTVTLPEDPADSSTEVQASSSVVQPSSNEVQDSMPDSSEFSSSSPPYKGEH